MLNNPIACKWMNVAHSEYQLPLKNETWILAALSPSKNVVEHLMTAARSAGLSMSKLDARCQLRAWDPLGALKVQFLELSLVLGCIIYIKLERATNRARELS